MQTRANIHYKVSDNVERSMKVSRLHRGSIIKLVLVYKMQMCIGKKYLMFQFLSNYDAFGGTLLRSLVVLSAVLPEQSESTLACLVL